MKKRVEKKRANRQEKLVRVAMTCAQGLHDWYRHPWSGFFIRRRGWQ